LPYLSISPRFTITSVARTVSDALSAFLRPHPQKSTPYPPKTYQNRSCEFYAHESLCTPVHGNRSAPRFLAWPLKPDEKSLAETVNGRINFLSGCEALDKRSASEKRLVEASGYQGHPLSTRMYTNGKNVPILSPFVYIRHRALKKQNRERTNKLYHHFITTLLPVMAGFKDLDSEEQKQTMSCKKKLETAEEMIKRLGFKTLKQSLHKTIFLINFGAIKTMYKRAKKKREKSE